MCACVCVCVCLRHKGKWENKHAMGIKQEDGTYHAHCKYESITGQSMLGWKSWHNSLQKSHSSRILNSTATNNQRAGQPVVPKISSLFCHETRVQTHGLGVSSQLWVLPNYIACGDLYFIWFSQIIYNSLMNWHRKRLNFAHLYHSLKKKY